MMNNFLIDKAFSRKYEEYFAEKISKKYCQKVMLNDGVRDDLGIDLYLFESGAKIDLKCYRKSKIPNAFKGVFIETYLPKSDRPGWYLDKYKKTTAYIFAIDCDECELAYKEAYLLSKEMLECVVVRAEHDQSLDCKSINSAHGFILPYEYLRQYGVRL